MKATELKGQTDADLALALAETEKRLFQLRFQSATDRLETPSEIRKAKRAIARIKTVQRARELTKLYALPDAELSKQADQLTVMAELPGKRTAKRRLARVERILADRGTKKGSGK